MPPPFFRPGQTVTTKSLGKGRICLRRGYRRTELPAGEYQIQEVRRDEEFYHVPEMSDGYTYRLIPTERKNPYYGKRISIWQNDLADAIYT
jgi:hypothetical protein